MVGSICKSRISNIEMLGKNIVNFSLVFLEPAIIIWSIWGLSITKDIFFLPLAGLSIVGGGFLIGRILIPIIKLKGQSAKTYIISSSLANHGFTMGGFICYLFLGETGIGLASIFILLFMPWVFIVIFPFARSGHVAGLRLKNLKNHFINRQNMPLYAVITAIIIQGTGIKRPQVNFPIDAFMIAVIVLYYFTLGINFNFIATFKIRKEQITLAAEKFLFIPLVTYLILSFTDLAPEIKKVIQIQSCMPAAIYSVLTSILHDLDIELATSLFVLNTILFIILVLPVLLILNYSVL